MLENTFIVSVKNIPDNIDAITLIDCFDDIVKQCQDIRDTILSSNKDAAMIVLERESGAFSTLSYNSNFIRERTARDIAELFCFILMGETVLNPDLEVFFRLY